MISIFAIKQLHTTCTGCGICQFSCPADAITLKLTNDGFFYPFVNQLQCINCGKCVKICHAISPPTIGKEPIAIICGYFSSYRLLSSSGGVVKAIADYVVNRGGIVFGATFDSTLQQVRHVSSDEVSVEELLGSKYVQSKIDPYIYSEVVRHMDTGRFILFCGTPCQIAALRKVIGYQNTNVVTIDFICHGVPSPGLFSTYISYLEKKYHSKVTNISFREKDYGWKNQHIKVYFSDGRIVFSKSRYDMFYFYFINNYSLRKSCFACPYSNKHFADLTLGDNWDSPEIIGSSIIFMNNNLGQQIFMEVKNSSFITEKELDIDKFDSTIFHHRYCIDKRNHFFSTNFFENLPFNEKVFKRNRWLPYWMSFVNRVKHILQIK